MILIVYYSYCVSLCFLNRAQLEKAKQGREDAEREKRELADRLKKFEKDTKRAEEGKRHVYIYIYVHTLYTV